MHLSDSLLEDLKARYRRAYVMNQRFVRVLVRAVHLCAPLSNGLNVLYGYNDTGRNENVNIYNSAPKYYSHARANALHSLLLPINKRWGSVHTTDSDGNDVYREDYTNKIFDTIDKSNLHSVAKAFFLDLNIGCAALWVNTPEKGKVTFTNIAGITLMPEYTDDPTTNNVWFKRTVDWYELNAISPETAKRNSSKEHEYSLTCGYLDLRETKGVESFVYIQFFEEVFSEPISIHKSPWRQLILVNETLRPGEARGHGIILQILEEIEYLNDITQSLKNYVRYSADPALEISDKIPGQLQELRGALLPSEVARDGRSSVIPIQWELNIQAVAALVKDTEEKIRQFFSIQPLGPPDAPPNMTATEVNFRRVESQRQAEADLSRVANETLGGIMRAVFDVHRYWGDIKVSDKQDIEFKFDSPAVDIQSQENLNALLQLSELNTQINGEGSGALYMNGKEVYDYLATNLRTPSVLNNSTQQIQSIMQNIRQKQQQQQQEQQTSEPATSPAPLSPAASINPTQFGNQSRISGVGF